EEEEEELRVGAAAVLEGAWIVEAEVLEGGEGRHGHDGEGHARGHGLDRHLGAQVLGAKVREAGDVLWSMDAAELGIALAHGAEARPGPALEFHGNLPHAKIELDARGAGAASDHAGRTQRGMAGEWELLGHREDAHLHSLRPLDAGIARQDERRLREIGLAGQTLELLLAQGAGVREDGDSVSLEGTVGEDVDDRVVEATHAQARLCMSTTRATGAGGVRGGGGPPRGGGPPPPP